MNAVLSLELHAMFDSKTICLAGVNFSPVTKGMCLVNGTVKGRRGRNLLLLRALVCYYQLD